MSDYSGCFECKHQSITTENEWLVCYCKRDGRKYDVKTTCIYFEPSERVREHKQTRLEYFLEQHPKAPLINGIPYSCAGHYFQGSINCSGRKKCKDCWNEEVK